MRIREKCSCGAEVEVQSEDATEVEVQVLNWREEHKHYTPPKYPYYGATVAPAVSWATNGVAQPQQGGI